MLDPHEIIAYLFNEIQVQIPEAAVCEYWQHSRTLQEPWATCHPASPNHIPLGFYGDSARIDTTFASNKVLGIFLNLPLWRPKSIRYSRFLIFAIEEKFCWKSFTLDTILRRVVWSLNLLYTGEMPLVDFRGAVLPTPSRNSICHNGAKFAVTEIRGDQLFHKEIFRFTSSWTWKSLRVCHKCDARSRGDCLYYAFDDWLPTEFSLEQFLALRMPQRNLSAMNFSFGILSYCFAAGPCTCLGFF